MLPSQSGHAYLPEKSAFLLGFQLPKAVIIVLGLVFLSLPAACSALAALGAGNRNGHCSNFQAGLGSAGLLSQPLTEWTFLPLPDIPEQGGNEMRGIDQSR